VNTATTLLHARSLFSIGLEPVRQATPSTE